MSSGRGIMIKDKVMGIWDNPFFKSSLIFYLFIVFLFEGYEKSLDLVLSGSKFYYYIVNHSFDNFANEFIPFLYLLVLGFVIVPLFIGGPKRITSILKFKELLNNLKLTSLPNKNGFVYTILGFLIVIFIVLIYGFLMASGTRSWSSYNFIYTLSSFINSGIWEEIFFRGYIYMTLSTRLSQRRSVLVTSVLFGLVHMSSLVYYPHYGYYPLFLHYLNQAIYTFFLGIIFNLLLIRTNSLWAPICFHYLFNVVLNLVFKYDYIYNYSLDFFLRILFLGILPLGGFYMFDKFFQSKKNYNGPVIDNFK